MDRRFEVVIAGAGPAGAGCAARLLRRDPALAGRILLVDRAAFPRDKPCGGGLTGHALDALAALGLTLRVAAQEAPRAAVRFGAFERELALPRPVRVVRRTELDADLAAQAVAMGAVLHEREAVTAFAADADGVTVRTGRAEYRARVLIGADGAASVVRRRLIPRDGPPMRLFRAELPALGRAPADRMLYDFTPMVDGARGYLWIFPAPGGLLNVGVMHYPGRPRSGAELVALLARRLGERGIAWAPSGGPAARGWPAWPYRPRARVAGLRALLVGDAAGIDALTGEGIGVALEHAIVAGDAALAVLRGADPRLPGYSRALRRASVGRELNLDRHLARLLYEGDGWRRWLPLVLFDERVLELYAIRIAGSVVLADRKRDLAAALARHLVRLGPRARRLDALSAVARG